MRRDLIIVLIARSFMIMWGGFKTRPYAETFVCSDQQWTSFFCSP
jgi:hypothetical protein